MDTNLEHVYWKYVFFLPIMWLLALYVRIKHFVFGLIGRGEPHTNTIWFDGLGVRNAMIRANAKCFRAMDVIYDYHLAKSVWDHFWIGMRNAQAVRNRGRVVRERLLEKVRSKYEFLLNAAVSGRPEIRILSLACGSARDVIDVIAQARTLGIAVKALLVDINPEALKAAEEYANERGVLDSIRTLQSDIVTVWSEAKEFAPHIVHIIGLLEYMPQDKAINLLSAVHAVLNGGVLVTSNTVDNLEAGFLRRVIGWNMIYRRAWQLEELLKVAGFQTVKIVGEPHGIQNVAVAQ